MSSLATPSATISILKKFNLRLSKKLGQNFLVDRNVLDKIVQTSQLRASDVVIEVGSGIGTLTQALGEKVKLVLTVEYDRTFLEILRETLKEFDNVEVIPADALKLNLNSLSRRYPRPSKMVSNLPYNIAAPLLIHYLADYPYIGYFVVMVQKEIAERMTASPGSKSYSAFSLKIQYYSQPQIISIVPRTVFIPPPQVDSAIVKIKRFKTPPVAAPDARHLFKVIEAAFAQRRKTIQNALSEGLNLNKGQVGTVLSDLKIAPNLRGESLSLHQFAQISEVLKGKIN